MITLYHGSFLPIPSPLSNAGRRNLDFGKGFYLTRLEEQAQKWARLVSSRKGDEISGVVSIYELDESVLFQEAITYKMFPSYDKEWLSFVVSCRQGKDDTLYDIVEGGVANDQVIDTVEDFENGRITAEQALDQLKFMKPNNQICIRNQQIIDQGLKYISSKFVQV